MTNFQQVSLSTWQAALSLKKMHKTSYYWSLIYLIMGVGVFSLLIALFISQQELIKKQILDYLFPQSWQSISESLIVFLYDSQAKSVIGNLILSSSLVFASIFLFPIKEKFSASFEKQGGYSCGDADEFPLYYQGLEEIKLFILYLTSQLIILWIGYYPYQWATYLSITLSYLFLFFTLSLDFIAPTLQRHRQKYASILKLLAYRPLLTLAFGFLFSLPAVLLSHWVLSVEAWSLLKMASVLFIANLFLLMLAIPAGTHVACQLLPQLKKLVPPSNKSRFIGYSTLVILLTIGLMLHSRLLLSLHHKSQLLKAEYSIDWSSFNYQMPSFKTLSKQTAQSKISFDIVIHNPSEFDIKVEPSRVQIMQHNRAIATIDIAGFSIAAGQQQKIPLTFNATTDFALTSQWNRLLTGWRIDWSVEIWPGIPFIINLLESEQ